jgi:hypothetical protein
VPRLPPACTAALAALALGALGGCAALPWPQRAVRHYPAPTSEGLIDLRGVVHVHTRASHDSPGRLQDVVRAARRAGVSWVALTEHTRPGGPVAEGTVEGVVLIPGRELRGWGGSILALGIEELPENYRDPVAAVRGIRAQGGLALLGHFENARLGAAEWEHAGLEGLEIANLHASAEASGAVDLALRGALLPAPALLRSLLRTPRENLQRWEDYPAADLVVGGVDAHAKVRLLGPLGGTVDRYARMFRLLTTHVLAAGPTREAVLEALRAGRSYVAFEGRGRVDRFRFERAGDAFEVEAPAAARLALVCDGELADFSEARTARLRIPSGAVRCRVEAWLDQELWIVTSYQRVAPPPSSARGGAGGEVRQAATRSSAGE